MDFLSKEERFGSEEGDSEEASWRGRGRSAGELTQEVIPVFGGRTQALDTGMEIAHALGHGIAGGIGVKAAVDGLALCDERA